MVGIWAPSMVMANPDGYIPPWAARRSSEWGLAVEAVSGSTSWAPQGSKAPGQETAQDLFITPSPSQETGALGGEKDLPEATPLLSCQARGPSLPAPSPTLSHRRRRCLSRIRAGRTFRPECGPRDAGTGDGQATPSAGEAEGRRWKMGPGGAATVWW